MEEATKRKAEKGKMIKMFLAGANAGAAYEIACCETKHGLDFYQRLR